MSLWWRNLQAPTWPGDEGSWYQWRNRLALCALWRDALRRAQHQFCAKKTWPASSPKETCGSSFNIQNQKFLKLLRTWKIGKTMELFQNGEAWMIWLLNATHVPGGNPGPEGRRNIIGSVWGWEKEKENKWAQIQWNVNIRKLDERDLEVLCTALVTFL